MDDSAFGDVVENIKTCLVMLRCSHFVHVFRESNNLAHKVAKLLAQSFQVDGLDLFLKAFMASLATL